MPAVFDHHRIVVPEEIDALGHVNNLAYMRWMIDAALAHSSARGWPQARHMQLGSGWVVRSHRIRYLRPARLGQPVMVRTWVAETKRVTSLRRFLILRPEDEMRLAVAETEWAYVSFATGSPTRIPPEVATAFEIVDQGVGLDD